MNAISPRSDDPAERRARHLRQCQRLAELGMDLAEAAHREAVRDLQPPPPRRPSPFPADAIMPGMPVPPPPSRDATFGLLFSKISRSVRQAILLEARIAAGAYDHPPPAPRQAPDPSGATKASPALHQPATAIHGAAPRPDRPEQVEDDLAGDTHRPVPELLSTIHRDLQDAIETGGPALSRAARTRPTAPSHPDAEPPDPARRPLTALERSAARAQRTRTPPPPD